MLLPIGKQTYRKLESMTEKLRENKINLNFCTVVLCRSTSKSRGLSPQFPAFCKQNISLLSNKRKEALTWYQASPGNCEMPGSPRGWTRTRRQSFVLPWRIWPRTWGSWPSPVSPGWGGPPGAEGWGTPSAGTGRRRNQTWPAPISASFSGSPA